MKILVIKAFASDERYYIENKISMVYAISKETGEIVAICYKDIRTKRCVAYIDMIFRIIYIESGEFFSDIHSITKEFPSYGVCFCDSITCKKDIKLVSYKPFDEGL